MQQYNVWEGDTLLGTFFEYELAAHFVELLEGRDCTICQNSTVVDGSREYRLYINSTDWVTILDDTEPYEELP